MPALGQYNVYVVCPARQNILKYVPAVDGSGYPTAGRTNYLGVPQDVSTVDDMYVDSAIYLVDGGQITRYESGRAVTGWTPGLPPTTKPEPFFFARLAANNNDNANPDQGTFYAYDSAGHRIVAFSKKDGAYVGQYAAPGDTSWFTHLNGMFVVPGTGTARPTLYWVESGNLMSASLGPSASATPTASGSAQPSAASSTPAGAARPNATYLVYTVKSGDTMSAIASRFALTLSELELANPQIQTPDQIEVGQLLNIPPPGSLTPPPASPGRS